MVRAAHVSLAESPGLLDALYGEGLLTETGYRRYGMHDLLRRYARDHAAAGPGTDQALGRLLDYYQHTAALAQDRLARQTRPGPPPATPAALPSAPALEDAGQALAWARAERDSLLACLDHATPAGQHARVTALTAALAELLRRDGPWTEAITRHATALLAARHLGDRLGEANALTHLGNVRRLTGDYQDAAGDLEQALTIYRNLGDRLGEANALTHLGIVRYLTGDYQGAAGDLEQALTIYRNLGNRGGEAEVLNETGTLHRISGEPAEAEACHQQALELARAIGSACYKAHALAGLGRCATAAGHTTRAKALLWQAHAIFQRIGAADTPAVLAELNAITSPGPGQ